MYFMYCVMYVTSSTVQYIHFIDSAVRMEVFTARVLCRAESIGSLTKALPPGLHYNLPTAVYRVNQKK